MDSALATPELQSPGLYFICKCRHAECSRRGKSVLFFLGIGREFLFTEAWHSLKCSACGEHIASVCSVGFFRCRWSFNGVLSDGDEFRDEQHYSYGYTVCTEPMKFRWKSLFLGAWKFTEQELQMTMTCIFKVLESPLETAKRPRQCEMRDASIETQSSLPDLHCSSTQTDTNQFTEQSLDQCVTLRREEVLKRLKAEVKRKEERFEKVKKEVENLREEVERIKRRRNM